tara:strand:+ start:646 stop:1059 length:414 start_codon:yes stop_codon:yes gene_type:complete
MQLPIRRRPARRANGALLDNGGISGQMQYRGSAGYRNAVRIDGIGINSGGANWMEPLLHYAPSALTDQTGDTETPMGTIGASSYDRRPYDLDFGRRWPARETTGFFASSGHGPYRHIGAVAGYRILRYHAGPARPQD